jgi:tripartite-type tricarboxylate transporter receptor subunit TctC
MTFSRWQSLHLIAGTAALPGISRIASVQTYPSHPILLIVPYPPGRATDVVACIGCDRCLVKQCRAAATR